VTKLLQGLRHYVPIRAVDLKDLISPFLTKSYFYGHKLFVWLWNSGIMMWIPGKTKPVLPSVSNTVFTVTG
jgi:hypothetical protein